MSAITIPNPLPALLVALSAEAVEQVEALTGRVVALAPITDAGTMRAADTLLSEVRTLAKQVTAARLVMTRPIDALKKAAMEAERAATQPLEAAEMHLAKLVLTWESAERARVEEERRQAEAERTRLQAEEDARAEAERAALQAALQAAVAEEDAYPGTPPAAVPEVSAIAAVPRAIQAAYVAPAVRSANVRPSTTYSVEVIDAAAVPVELAGIMLRPIDTAAALRLLRQGATIPGIRLVSEDGFARKGQRA
jgi:hypothetical protein